MNTPSIRRRLAIALIAVVTMSLAIGADSHEPARAQEGYQRISGEGSSWAANAIDAMRVNVEQFGMTVDYNPSGSTSGRKNFLNGIVDFAASDIPFQFEPEDGSEPDRPEPGSYVYIPVVAGGTAFMYNLKINGQPVTNLRLSGENVAKIFTGLITTWNDPAIAADNPGLTLPARPVVPVVRADGSGSSAQFTLWMIDRYPQIWQDFCERSGRAPACGFTSFYPTVPGMIAKSQDTGVAGFVGQSSNEGTIGYVNYSYALNQGFPVAKVLNAAGYYTEPTPENVAVSLLKADVNTDESNPAVYLTQKLDGVYTDTDPRNYQLSSYSYFILPTKVQGQFNADKGRTLGAFAYYAMCQAQQQSASLGYSPMPINLVQRSFEQIVKIPGVEVQNVDIRSCDNPTFSPDGRNVLAENAPMPKECDRQGTSQCPDGTAGMSNIATQVNNPAPTGGGDNGGELVGGGDEGVGDANDGSGENAVGGGGDGGAVGGGGVSGGGVGQGGGGGGTTGGGSSSGAATTTTVPGAVASGSSDGGQSVAAPDGGSPVSAGDVCDPDTGVCLVAVGEVIGDQTGQVASPQQATGGPAVGAVTPVDVGNHDTWGNAALAVLVAVLLLALVLAPAFLWTHLAKNVPA